MATACTFSRCRVWYGLNNSFWRNPVHLWQKIKSHNQSNYTHFPPSSSITICRNQFSYGSVSAWREIWLFRVIFFQKVQCWSMLVNICWIFCNLLGGPRQPQASKWWWWWWWWWLLSLSSPISTPTPTASSGLVTQRLLHHHLLAGGRLGPPSRLQKIQQMLTELQTAISRVLNELERF